MRTLNNQTNKALIGVIEKDVHCLHDLVRCFNYLEVHNCVQYSKGFVYLLKAGSDELEEVWRVVAMSTAERAHILSVFEESMKANWLYTPASPEIHYVRMNALLLPIVIFLKIAWSSVLQERLRHVVAGTVVEWSHH